MIERTGTSRNTEPRITPAIHELLERIQGKYREMPGLSLTASQAQRLWGLDSTTCGIVLTTLVGRKVLRRTPIGRPSGGVRLSARNGARLLAGFRNEDDVVTASAAAWI